MLGGISDRLGSSFPGGELFTMEEPIRAFEGPRIDFDTAPLPFRRPADEKMCERWAVLTSTLEPTEEVNQLDELSGWCVVVVGDKNGPAEYDVAGVTFLTPDDQEALPYRLTKLLPWSHFGRKNVGYIYAIHHGAKVIYDVDIDNTLIHPEELIPHVDMPDMPSPGYEPPCRFSSSPSSIVHNPYGCSNSVFSWPRGYPLSEIQRQNSSTCKLEVRGGNAAARIGVVQALANGDPDVDAIFHLTHPPGGLPFDLTVESPGAPGCRLRGVPAGAMTPYNAQATLHFPVAFWGMLLPVTVHGRVSDIWRSYFTQALLPSAGAVAAFAPAWVERVRDRRNHLADFQAELPLYERSGALVEFLLKYRQAEDTASTSNGLTPSQVEDLAVTMFEYGIVEGEDVALTQAWLQDLRDADYDFQAHVDQSEPQAGKGSQQRPSSQLSVAVAMATTGARPYVMLVIAVVSARPERRDAIRDSWLAWGDVRVEVRFFTEVPAAGSVEALALEEESAVHGDLVLMDIDPGMNFALKLLRAMRWMESHFDFDFFLRLDDDYFLCLRRLLDELAAVREVGVHPLNFYAGHMYCDAKPGETRIDEAYLLLSAELVRRALTTPDLRCGAHAGTTAGWWFAKGNALNQLGDVRWVHDPRLDHHGGVLQQPSESFGDICVAHMGVHHAFPEVMLEIWDAAKDTPGPLSGSHDEAASEFRYSGDEGGCKMGSAGISDTVFEHDNGQSCDTFVSTSKTIHCGAGGC